MSLCMSVELHKPHFLLKLTNSPCFTLPLPLSRVTLGDCCCTLYSSIVLVVTVLLSSCCILPLPSLLQSQSNLRTFASRVNRTLASAAHQKHLILYQYFRPHTYTLEANWTISHSLLSNAAHTLTLQIAHL